MMARMDEEARRAERPDLDPGSELVDAGDGRRLERFGDRVVDRPAPGAVGARLADMLTWRRADLRFAPKTGWFGEPSALEPWTVAIDGLRMELRPTAAGGLGVYPEHAANLAWVAARIAERVAAPVADRAAGAAEAAGAAPSVLNLFAHTGLLTLGAVRAGAAVTHVDASRAAVAWARRNADLSGLAGRPIRWITDDVAGFVAREARRGRRYDGIVLDPPSFGRAGRRQWKLVEELPALLEACRVVAADDAFVLLTAHTTGLAGGDMRDALREAFGTGPAEVLPLSIEAMTGARLDLGWAVRVLAARPRR